MSNLDNNKSYQQTITVSGPPFYGFWQSHTFNADKFPVIESVSEYKNEPVIGIACTQLFTDDQARKKKVLSEWIQAIPRIPAAYISLNSLVPQRLLDAVCDNTTIKGLSIKQTNAKSIQPIKKLTALEQLRLGNASQICDILPISNLTKLKILNIENLMHIEDYSSLGSLKSLECLSIEGGMYSRPSIRDLDFVSELVHLRSFHLVAMRCKNRSIKPFMGLSRLEDLFLCFREHLKREELDALSQSLPHLKWADKFYDKRQAENVARLLA